MFIDLQRLHHHVILSFTIFFSVKMTATDNTRRLTILYGSQTGTAQDVAERVYRQSYCRRFTTKLFDLDSYLVVSNWLCIQKDTL